jgi:hypothetical protein
MTGFTGPAGPTGKTGNITPPGYKYGQINKYDPQSMETYNQYRQLAGPESFTARLAGGDQSAFEQMEAPALRQFSELQGGLASRFSGMGTGARRSSGFQNTATAAGQNFAEQLQSQRMGYQRQAVQDIRGMYSDLLQNRPYEQFLTKKDQPFWQQLLLAGTERGAEAATKYGLSLIP